MRYSATPCFFLILMATISVGFSPWNQAKSSPPGALTSAILNPSEPGQVLLATSQAIYQSGLKNPAFWKKKIAGDFSIRRIETFGEIPSLIFALTQKGLYIIHPSSGWKWEKTYAGGAADEKEILSFTVLPGDPDHWFAGTGRGLIESDDAGKSWEKFPDLNGERICAVSAASDMFMAATPHTLYISKDLTRFAKAFSVPLSEEMDKEDFEDSEEENKQIPECKIHDILSTNHGRNIWIASSKGIYQSENQGKTWREKSIHGLKQNITSKLAYSPAMKMLFAGARNQIFLFDFNLNRWQTIFQTPLSEPILDLKVSKENNKEVLLAVTAKNFYSYFLPEMPGQVETYFSVDTLRRELFSELADLEPSAQEVNLAALTYSNTHNSKTKRWQRLSRIASFLPDVSFGHDFSRDNNVDIDRGATTTPDEFISGPDDISKGWDFNIGWDLGDLIWSSNQTSIDSREKLMVELRNDILAEVTRLYFERRLLQNEVALGQSGSLREHQEKLLRIDELTALLDGMTGGFLSFRLQTIYQNHPEYKSLWIFRGEENAGDSSSLFPNQA